MNISSKQKENNTKGMITMRQHTCVEILKGRSTLSFEMNFCKEFSKIDLKGSLTITCGRNVWREQLKGKLKGNWNGFWKEIRKRNIKWILKRNPEKEFRNNELGKGTWNDIREGTLKGTWKDIWNSNLNGYWKGFEMKSEKELNEGSLQGKSKNWFIT